MAHKLPSDVRETSITGGTGNQILAGAIDPTYVAFGARLADGDTSFACLKQGTSRELSKITYNLAANSITRSQVYKSTNGNALVNFTAGQAVDIFVTNIGPDDLDDAGRMLLAGFLFGQHGADVASAATLNLESATGDLVDVTGTTAVTAITLAEGRARTVRFTGALTLTNGASLVLPGGANITTAAGDFAVFRGYASGVVRCVQYTPTSGQLSLGVQSLISAQQDQVRANIGIAGKNRVINGGFGINERGYASGTALANGKYGHDRWKGGLYGGDYSFTQLVGAPTVITVAANKSLIQVISDVNIDASGSYTLSWTGSATARVGVNTATPSGNFAVSPITVTGQNAGSLASIEFTGANAAGTIYNGTNTGTFTSVQYEVGTKATPFEFRLRSIESLLCKRHFYRRVPPAVGGVNATSSVARLRCAHPVEMMTTPTLTLVSPLPVFDLTTATTITSIPSGYSTASVLEFDGACSGSGLVVGRPALVYQGAGGDLWVEAEY